MSSRKDDDWMIELVGLVFSMLAAIVSAVIAAAFWWNQEEKKKGAVSDRHNWIGDKAPERFTPNQHVGLWIFGFSAIACGLLYSAGGSSADNGTLLGFGICGISAGLPLSF